MTLTDEPPTTPDRRPERDPRGPATPGVGLLEAIRGSLLIVLVSIVVLVGIGVVVGLARKPTYTSEARLNVGGLSLNQQSIQGYSIAVQYLAIAYARAIDATGVIAPVSRQLGLPPLSVVKQVSATPIQGSPVIAVDATSKDPGQAVRLADATSNALVSYATSLNSGATASQQLKNRYVAASRTLESATAALAKAPPNSAQQRAAQSRVDLARLEQQTAGALYSQSQAGQADQNLVQKLAPAGPVTSDRGSVLQQYAAGGLLAGILIGVGIALERANRRAVRRPRRERGSAGPKPEAL